MSRKVRFEVHGPRYVGLVRYLRRELPRCVAHLPKGGRELELVSVALVGDVLMSRLHLASHGDGRPTDVLTYELDWGNGALVSEGEIVICVPEARRRALEDTICTGGRGLVDREVLLYALHGLLHLSGMEDKTPAGFKAIHAMEDDILQRIGIGRVFEREQSGSSVRARQSVGRGAGRKTERKGNGRGKAK